MHIVKPYTTANKYQKQSNKIKVPFSTLLSSDWPLLSMLRAVSVAFRSTLATAHPSLCDALMDDQESKAKNTVATLSLAVETASIS